MKKDGETFAAAAQEFAIGYHKAALAWLKPRRQVARPGARAAQTGRPSDVLLSLVTDADYAEQLKGLDATLRNIEIVLDLPRMRKDKDELEAAASEPSLWDDPARAQQVTSKLSHVQAEIGKVERLRGRLDDAGVLLELAQSEDDAGLAGRGRHRGRRRCTRRSTSWRSAPCSRASTTPARRS